MTNGAGFDAIWAHAPIYGGQAQSHTANAATRGTFWMQLNTIRSAAYAVTTSVIIMISCLCAIFM